MTLLHATLALALAIPFAVAQIPEPPQPLREFRAAWVATVGNINWPSKAELPVAAQQAEMLALLDKAAALGLNAIVFQVRPAGDALYRSALEPWSYYLSGTMGKTPEPAWDPLEFACTEAHKRGLELHAWFNPFRALTSPDKHPAVGNHIAKLHPEWCIRYGSTLWMDPGIAGVRDRARAVLLDVARRYEVDGIHIDDYFYPYPLKDKNKQRIEFADDSSFSAYQATGGALERSAWRRQNIDSFVQSVYADIKAAKRWVKVGISPFGLYRPNVPEGTGKGALDPFEELGADSLKWLHEGWLDYLAPQLYWPIEPTNLSFKTYYDWWLSENTAHRHIFPGIATDRIGTDRGPIEILQEISAVRSRQPLTPSGHLHWNFKSLSVDKSKVATLLKSRAYTALALPPATPWLGNEVMPDPIIQVEMRGAKKFAKWTALDPAALPKVGRWVLQTYAGKRWQTKAVLPAGTTEIEWPKGDLAIAVRACGLCWEVGEARMVAVGVKN